MSNQNYSTQQVADATNHHRQTVYARYKRTGSFHGVVPTKQLNGRLLWPADAIMDLVVAEGAQK